VVRHRHQDEAWSCKRLLEDDFHAHRLGMDGEVERYGSALLERAR
jgi:hypothetical protein